jgi:polar amino acid transport system substrate-binding protein
MFLKARSRVKKWPSQVARLFVSYWLVFCTLLPSFLVQADKVKVVTEYLPPYQVKMADGSLGGYATEVINELFKITGDTADIHILPWARAYDASQNEENILIFSIAHTPKRASLFHWVGSLQFERFYFWGLKSAFSHYDGSESINDLKNLHIATSNDYNTEQYLTDSGFKNIYKVVTSNQSLMMLDRNRMDIILSNELVLKSLCKSMNFEFSKLKKLSEAIELKNDLSIAFGLNTSPKLVYRFKKAYLTLKVSGKLAEIKKKWSIIDEH